MTTDKVIQKREYQLKQELLGLYYSLSFEDQIRYRIAACGSHIVIIDEVIKPLDCHRTQLHIDWIRNEQYKTLKGIIEDIKIEIGL
jgi:hypothetical protein